MLKWHNAATDEDTPATLNAILLAEIEELLGTNPTFSLWLKISSIANLSKKIQVTSNTDLNRVPFLQYTNFKGEVWS